MKNNGSLFYWIVIGILLTGCIYLFVSKNKQYEGPKTEVYRERNKQID